MTTILALLYAGIVEHWNPVWSLSAIGIITFFGMLIVSSLHQVKVDSQGTMRKALASSMVIVYLIVFTLIIFGFDFAALLQDESPTGLTSSEILDHLTKIILVILGFYFGFKGIKEIVKEKAKNSKDAKDSKYAKNSKTQTTVEKIPTTFTPDTPPGIDPPKPIKHTHD